jgi:hypothetical protein
MIWSDGERPDPTRAEIEAVEAEAMRLLSSIGASNGVASAADCLAALVFAKDFEPGGAGQTRYIIQIAKFIAARVAQHGRRAALLPADIRDGRVH